MCKPNKDKNQKNKLIIKAGNDKSLKHKLMNNSKGFTLMEVIIVIAIIAILMSIAIPSITGYMESAKEVSDMSTARSVLIAAQAGVIEARASGELESGTIVTIGWSTRSASPTYGKIFVGEGGGEGEISAVLPSGYVRDKNNDFTSIRDSIISKVGGKVSSFTHFNYGYIDFEFPESKIASQYALYVHIDSSTGEMALAGTSSNANKNIWIDEIGLDITPVP